MPARYREIGTSWPGGSPHGDDPTGPSFPFTLIGEGDAFEEEPLPPPERYIPE